MKENKKSQELHIRVSKDFETNLRVIAESYGLCKSTFARAVLEQNVPLYTRNRLF